MIIKHNLISIPENNIFKNDKLNRRPIIQNLSKFVANTSEPLSLAINAKWGDGKTTFIRLWKEYLKKESEIQSIYFNAWEYDYSNEPLILLIGELNKFIKSNYQQDEEVKSKFQEIKETGTKIIIKALPAFVSGATGGFLKIDEGFEHALSALSEETVKTLINNYSEEKDIIEEFQTQIRQLLEKIAQDKPFIIFVDELDRCKPIFAISLLERIKHVFGIDGLIFVFSIDKIQLIESIKSQYGNIDGENYLKRFFDLEYSLPLPDKEMFCDYLNEYYDWSNLFHRRKINDFIHRVNHLEMVKYLSKSLDLSLREIEKIFLYTDLVYKTLPEHAFEVLLRMFIFYITIKIKNEKLYNSLVNKKEPPEYFLEILIKENLVDDYGDTPKITVFIEALVYLTVLNQIDIDKLVVNKKNELEKLLQENSNRENIDKLERLIFLLTERVYDFNRLRDFIPLVINSIEFSSSFNV